MRASRWSTLAVVACLSSGVALAQVPEGGLAAASAAYERGEFAKAIELAKAATAKNPNDGEAYLLLTKAYLQTDQRDAAVSSGEKAVASNPKNSEYHDWLGQAYGEKAAHASMLSAYPLARKTQKEFETAVELDEHNYEAAQNLVEYDCSAPSIVGGGEDKAAPVIQKLMSMDASQGHYAQGNCKSKKNDAATASAEFRKALQSQPKSAMLIFNIADYFMGQKDGNGVGEAVKAGQAVAPGDARLLFYRGVAAALRNDGLSGGEKDLKEYLQRAPHNPDYPPMYAAHAFLGLIYEHENNAAGAKNEYQAALQLNSKSKIAQEGLARVGGK